MKNEKLHIRVSEYLNLVRKKSLKMQKWSKFLKNLHSSKYEIIIGIVGKYTELHDAYKSILESFVHAGVENNTNVEVVWLNTEKIHNYDEAKKRNLEPLA